MKYFARFEVPVNDSVIKLGREGRFPVCGELYLGNSVGVAFEHSELLPRFYIPQTHRVVIFQRELMPKTS